MRSVFRLALGAVLLAPAAAAQTVSSEQAQALQKELKDWAAGLFGPSVKLPELPLEVTGEQDHYRLAIRVAGFDGPDGDVALTAGVRPLDGGRWSLDAVKVPASGSFTVTLPATGDQGAGGQTKLSFTMQRQDSHGVIDPAFASNSTFHTEFAGLAVASDNGKQHQEEKIDRYVTDTSLLPAPDGRLDLTSNGTMEGWKSATVINGQTPMALGAQTIRATGSIKGISRDHVAELLAAAGGMFGALPEHTDAKTELSEPAKAQLRLIIAAMQGFMSSVSLEETLDDVQVEVAGVGGAAIKHFKIGFGGEAPAGEMHAWLDLGLDGLTSPSIPPKVATYLPHHFEIKPSLSGVRTEDLQKLAIDSTKDDGSDLLAPDIAALLSHGGAKVNLETLSFDLGPAKVDGTGTFTALAPDQWHGEAHLAATGFDELMKQARGNPDLAQALPGLIMLRGMAKPDGNRLVWEIVSDGPNLTVNGVDMSALTGGGGGGGGKPARPGHPAKP